MKYRPRGARTGLIQMVGGGHIGVPSGFQSIKSGRLNCDVRWLRTCSRPPHAAWQLLGPPSREVRVGSGRSKARGNASPETISLGHDINPYIALTVCSSKWDDGICLPPPNYCASVQRLAYEKFTASYHRAYALQAMRERQRLGRLMNSRKWDTCAVEPRRDAPLE